MLRVSLKRLCSPSIACGPFICSWVLTSDARAASAHGPRAPFISSIHSNVGAGHFRYFLIFSRIKTIFCIFYQVHLTGSGLFKLDWCRNRYWLDKNAKKIIFLLLKKFKNTESAQLCPGRAVTPFPIGFSSSSTPTTPLSLSLSLHLPLFLWSAIEMTADDARAASTIIGRATWWITWLFSRGPSSPTASIY